jgi:chromate transporter
MTLGRDVHRDPGRRQGTGGRVDSNTAAVVGVILNLSIWLALHMIFRETSPMRSFARSFDMPVWSSIDWAALVLAVSAATAIFPFNIGTLAVLAGSCLAGLAMRMLEII